MKHIFGLILALMLGACILSAAAAEIPEALTEEVSRELGMDDVTDSLLLRDGSGTEWCAVVTRSGGLFCYALLEDGWSCQVSGFNLFWSEDTRLVPHTAGEAGPDGIVRADSYGFDTVSDALDARMSWHRSGEEGFVLTGWRDGAAWPGNVVITEDSLRYLPDDGSEARETALDETLKSWLWEFDRLPKTPEDAAARTGISRSEAAVMYPGWTMAYYAYSGDTSADAGYYRLEDGMLQIRRAELSCDPETETVFIDLAAVPVTESFGQQLEAEGPNGLLETSGYNDTFLVPDAVDTAKIPIPGTILQNEILQYGLACLTEENGIRRIAWAAPDYEGGWTVQLSQPLPPEITLDFFHNGINEIPCSDGYDFSCGFVRNRYGEWNLSWVTSDAPYEITWYGLRGTDDEGEDILAYGTFPDRSLFEADLARIPRSLEAAAGMLDSSDWAVVRNEKAESRLHLREKPDRDGRSIGKFYNGTPVQILEASGEWVKVRVGGHQSLVGWMMKEYLAFGNEARQVKPAFEYPALMPEHVGGLHYAGLNGELAADSLTGTETVIGVYEDKTQSYLIVASDAGDVSYVPADWYWEGNG